MLLTSMLFIYNSQAAVAIQNSDQKSIFEYSAKEMEQTFQVDWGWKEKLGWWLVRKSYKRTLSKKHLLTEREDSTECYKIELVTGYVFYARNVRVDGRNVKYRNCSNDHYRFKISQQKVAYIWDKNRKIIFSKESQELELKERRANALSITGLTFMLFGILMSLFFPISWLLVAFGSVLGVLGFIYSLIYPEKVKNRSLSIWVFVFSLLLIGLTGLTIALPMGG